MSRIIFFINYTLFLVVVLTCSHSFAAAETDYFNVIEKLHVNLLQSYNNQIRPVLNHTESLKVEVSMKITSFNFDELQSRFSAIGYFYMQWKDPRFMWSPAEYEGLETIHLPNDKIWKPDLEVYNSYGLLSKDRSFASSTDVLISYDGSIFFVPMSNLVSICIPDATYYPFDSVTCTTKIGSWTHNALKLNISLKDNESTIDITDLINKRMFQWNLISTKVSVEVKKYDCCPELYQSMIIYLTIQRSLSTSSAITTPTIVILVLILATFFIPSTLTKLWVGFFNLTLLCTYLLYFKTTLPAGNFNTPLIISFYNGSLVVVISSILSTILSLRWTQIRTLVLPPTFIQNCLSGRIGTILGVTHKVASTNQAEKELVKKMSHQFVPKEDESREIEIKQHWINICLAFDRIMAIIYLTFLAFHLMCFFY